MTHPRVYVALQQFCESDDRPRKVLLEGGCELRCNPFGRRMRREELLEELRDVDAVMAGLEAYDAKLLDDLPRLKCISRCGVGTDRMDLEAAKRHQIFVFTTPDAVTEPVAEITVAMILALARNFPWHLHEIRQGIWKRRTGHLLSEWTVGLVGFGRIGKAVEQYLRAFGPKVLVSDPKVKPIDVSSKVEFCDLMTLLSQADVVSLHADRRREEGHLIGAQEIARMKEGSYLVNTSRGFLIDELALGIALENAHLAGAALDVFEEEPYSGPLTRMPQVICTPHVASFTRASRAAMELQCAQHVVTFFNRQSSVADVNGGTPVALLGKAKQRGGIHA